MPLSVFSRSPYCLSCLFLVARRLFGPRVSMEISRQIQRRQHTLRFSSGATLSTEASSQERIPGTTSRLRLERGLNSLLFGCSCTMIWAPEHQMTGIQVSTLSILVRRVSYLAC